MKMEPGDHSEAKRATGVLKVADKPEAKEVSRPKYVEDDSIMKRMLPELVDLDRCMTRHSQRSLTCSAGIGGFGR